MPHRWTHPSSGYSPYATWARDSVDALWWLGDVDGWAYSGDRANLGQHDPDVIDVAHVRWATGTAKTAVDLCVADAAVGHGTRFWGNGPEDFAWQPVADKLKKQHAKGDVRLRPSVASWLSVLVTDEDYMALVNARHAFTHRMTVRAALLRTRPPRGHQERTPFAVRIPRNRGRPDARALILFSRDVATRQVERYLHAASLDPNP